MSGGQDVQDNGDNGIWDNVSFVISSRYRVAVLRRLAEGPVTPTHIAEDVDARVAHVSRAIGQLRDQGLVRLLVSEDRRKGRVYGLTSTGEQVWGIIEDEGMN
jgi:DNA-binding transcriptional ArsR family regulator